MKRERAVRIAIAGCLLWVGVSVMGCGSKDETDAKPTTANAAPPVGAEGGPVLTNGPVKEGAGAAAAPVANDGQMAPRVK